MYQEGGVAYVYLCYGIHHLFNVVTNVKGLADAVLIRAIEPVTGLDVMKNRRDIKKRKYFTSGPGMLSKALSIETKHTGINLRGDRVYLASLNEEQPEIHVDVRIGVDYAGDDALKPWRFLIRENQWVSIKKSLDRDRSRPVIQTPVIMSCV